MAAILITSAGQVLTGPQVLATFDRDVPLLLLGAGFVSAGVVMATFALIARKFSAVLFWLSTFAVIYGLRLWLQLGMVRLMMPSLSGFRTVQAAINYLVPLPGFLYFEAAGFLGRRGRWFVGAATVFFLILFAATMVLGYREWIDRTNSIAVILSFAALTIYSLRRRPEEEDWGIVRAGLLVFMGFVVFNNLAEILGHHRRLEPVGFAVFLGTLGYVAARRTLRRDQQLSDIHKELDIARRIQNSILPQGFPPSPHFQVAARYLPMTAVAGDLYDFLVAGESQAGLLIADVSGHGVPAALIGSMVKLAATTLRPHASDPAALLDGMNQALCGNTQQQFVTAAYVWLEAASGTLRYAAAAHPPMLLLRNGEVFAIEENGLMLAAFSFATYTTASRPLVAGDRLLLFTDGVIEANDSHETEFGMERLSGLLAETRALPAEDAADKILHAVQSWAQIQEDDLTLLVCDYLG